MTPYDYMERIFGITYSDRGPIYCRYISLNAVSTLLVYGVIRLSPEFQQVFNNFSTPSNEIGVGKLKPYNTFYKKPFDLCPKTQGDILLAGVVKAWQTRADIFNTEWYSRLKTIILDSPHCENVLEEIERWQDNFSSTNPRFVHRITYYTEFFEAL